MYNGVNGQVVLIANRLASGVVHEVFVVFAIFHFQAFDLLAAVEALCILLIMISAFSSQWPSIENSEWVAACLFWWSPLFLVIGLI